MFCPACKPNLVRARWNYAKDTACQNGLDQPLKKLQYKTQSKNKWLIKNSSLVFVFLVQQDLGGRGQIWDYNLSSHLESDAPNQTDQAEELWMRDATTGPASILTQAHQYWDARTHIHTYTYTQVFFSASLDVFVARVEGVDLSSTSLKTRPLCPDNHSSGLSLSASIFRVLWREGSGGPEEVHWVQFKSTVRYQSVLVVKIGEL